MSAAIPVHAVVIPDDRKRGQNLAETRRLMESIREVGLLNPITVTKDNVLVSGLHRLSACQLLGWTEIPAHVVELAGLKLELAEIDENLIRNELSALERGEHLARRKEIYEVLHPDAPTGAGRPKKNAETISSFVADTAAKTGVTERTVQQDVQLAQRIAPDVRDAIRDTETADRKTDLLALSRMSEAKQRKLAAAGPEAIREAAKATRKPAPDTYLEDLRNRIKTPEGKQDKRKEGPTLGPPCDGMQFARLAIMDLEQIRGDDAEREEAFAYVKQWIGANE